MLDAKQVKKLSDSQLHYAIADILQVFNELRGNIFKEYLQVKLIELDILTNEKYNR